MSKFSILANVFYSLIVFGPLPFILYSCLTSKPPSQADLEREQYRSLSGVSRPGGSPFHGK